MTKKKAESGKSATHTPGPWKFIEGDRDRMAMSDVVLESDDEFRIAYVLCEFRSEQARATDIANARLIASAPDLLEVLEMVATLDRATTAGEKRKIAAVIAKAKGA
jgi:hypothetical protein